MKNIPMKKILAIISLAAACSACAGYQAFAQQNGSDSAVHEMPQADQCSLIILHIRELASSVKQVNREISQLVRPVRSASESDEVYGHRMYAYERQLDVLQEQEYSLRRQIDLKERQLESCLHHDSLPEQKEPDSSTNKMSN